MAAAQLFRTDVARYGEELEGAHKGQQTLVLLRAGHHSLALVTRLLARHWRTATHLWLQVLDGERYDWTRVAELRSAGYLLTLQVRDRDDLPPGWLREQVSLVWKVPAEYAEVALACGHLTAFGDGGPFDGNESELRFRKFDAARYARDEEWTCE